MTFQQMIAIEPKLQKLLETVQRVIDDPAKPCFCRLSVWYCGYSMYDGASLRTRLDQLVGYHAGNRQLNKPGLYEICEATILAAMAPCRGCACVTIHSAPPAALPEPTEPAAPPERRHFAQPRFPARLFYPLNQIIPVCRTCGRLIQPATPKKTKAQKVAEVA